VLVCYLDDSGKDPQNRITTLAGYVASDDAWRAFEAEVETWFTEFGVSVLHAKDLHHTDGEFKGWTVLRKQAFIARLCQAMSHHLALGVSMSSLKETYATRAAETHRNPLRVLFSGDQRLDLAGYPNWSNGKRRWRGVRHRNRQRT
jgi:uncharacterized protein DUF3800